MISRPPHPALRPFVSQLWSSERGDAGSSSHAREHALPTGAMHLVFRFAATPLRLYRSSSDTLGFTVGHALIGGVRSTHYIRDTSTPSMSVGAMLRPGSAELLFDATAEALAERHTSLDCVWGTQAALIHECLSEAPTPEARLQCLERELLRRLPTVRGLHPAVAVALAHFDGVTKVETVVEYSGYSHRRFIAQFRRAVGMTPKTYSRIQRFQQTLALTQGRLAPDWSQIAVEMGFADQAHLIRDFKAFAGVTPEQYRLSKPLARNHLPR